MTVDFYHWHRRAQDSIAQAALTNSKMPQRHVKGIYPTHLVSGKGCFVRDFRGKKYIDFICGLGTNLLGYANDRVNMAIAEQAVRGASLSLSTTIEVETAETLKELFPFVDSVKFLKSGSEACSAAIRIARAFTGRSKVLSEGFHGWHDDFTSLTPPAAGIPAGPDYPRAIAKLSDAAIDGQTAAVIVEPVSIDYSRARIEWLKALRAECTKHGALLIFDEVITGFRFRKYSVSSLYGVEPDMICLGKAMANGMALAAVGGKFCVMNHSDYFVSSTFAGETLSLASAKETMRLLQVRYSVEELWLRGADFLDRFNAIWPDGVTIEGYPSRGIFRSPRPETLAIFFQEACKGGILFGPSWFFSFAHFDDYREALGICKDVLARIKAGGVKLEGELPEASFSERVRKE